MTHTGREIMEKQFKMETLSKTRSLKTFDVENDVNATRQFHVTISVTFNCLEDSRKLDTVTTFWAGFLYG